MVDAIVPIFNALPVAFQALLRLVTLTPVPVRLIMIDNASDEDSSRLRTIFPDPHILIRNPENVGVYKALNQALALVESDLVIICCTDHWVQPHWFQPCAQAIAELRIGWAAPNWRDGPYRVRYDWDALQPPTTYQLLHGFGSSCAVLDWKRLKAEVGLFDEQFFLVFGDTDYLERMNDARIPAEIIHGTRTHHLGNQSRRGHGIETDVRLEIADATRFREKWKTRPEVLARHAGIMSYIPECAEAIARDRMAQWAELDPGNL